MHPSPASTDNQRDRDPAQELQVRKTAQYLLGKHLRRPPHTSGEDAQSIKASRRETFWPGISVYLRGATLVNLELSSISVIQASFHEANFTDGALFDGATFTGHAGFGRTNFTGDAVFYDAMFCDGVRFDGAAFTDAGFIGATFRRYAWFSEARFGDAWFSGATFSGAAVFDDATFSGGAEFSRTTLPDDARFNRTLILRLDDPDLNKSGENARRLWPNGWTVQRDADNRTCGTLVPEQGNDPRPVDPRPESDRE
jgi:hypothetical protein